MNLATSHMQNDLQQRRAFTLVELMVVVGIIALLITIIVPAVGAARKAAKVAASKATISALETGAESFRADSKFNGAYPPSSTPVVGAFSPDKINKANSPDNGSLERYEGAHFLAWALVGADMLGTPGFRDLNNDEDRTWADDTGNAGGLYTLENGKPKYPRTAAYVDPSKMTFPKRTGVNEYKIDELPTKPTTTSICFLDKFNQPILYYKANPVAVDIASSEDPTAGIYCIGDNRVITGRNVDNSDSGDTEGMDLGGGYADTKNRHHLAKFITTNPPAIQTFQYAIYNPGVTATLKPHRADSFLLISPGPNGIYGDSDDITNYPLN